MNIHTSQVIIKRIIDILASFILIIFFIPLFLIVSFLIITESNGLPIFTQKRIGLKRKIFRIIKFRTMINNAESIGTGIFTNKDDARITKIGRLLRKYSLDELPQLFNIFFGQMSFIGPRPPVPFFPYEVDNYPEEYIKRFDMRPGISGLAQISGRTNITWQERFVFDIEYVSSYSLILDAKIIFMTLIKIIKKDNIYPSSTYIKNHHKLK
jgi:undecaprenyl phosphate N,N'-diacetylbacillosamine 1-phosphate transferase